jgi:hypothetical protein
MPEIKKEYEKIKKEIENSLKLYTINNIENLKEFNKLIDFRSDTEEKINKDVLSLVKNWKLSEFQIDVLQRYINVMYNTGYNVRRFEEKKKKRRK